MAARGRDVVGGDEVARGTPAHARPRWARPAQAARPCHRSTARGARTWRLRPTRTCRTGSLPSCCQAASPSYRPREPSSKSSVVAKRSSRSATSASVGQMSASFTGVPSARVAQHGVGREVHVHRAGQRVGDHRSAARAQVVLRTRPGRCGPRSCGCPTARWRARGRRRCRCSAGHDGAGVADAAHAAEAAACKSPGRAAPSDQAGSAQAAARWHGCPARGCIFTHGLGCEPALDGVSWPPGPRPASWPGRWPWCSWSPRRWRCAPCPSSHACPFDVDALVPRSRPRSSAADSEALLRPLETDMRSCGRDGPAMRALRRCSGPARPRRRTRARAPADRSRSPAPSHTAPPAPPARSLAAGQAQVRQASGRQRGTACRCCRIPASCWRCTCAAWRSGCPAPGPKHSTKQPTTPFSRSIFANVSATSMAATPSEQRARQAHAHDLGAPAW